MPRPSSHTPALAALICERLADGRSLREVCRAEDMPSRETVRCWLRDMPEFERQYAQAIEKRADAWLEEIIEIADDSTNDWMERRRADGSPERAPDPEQIARSKLRIATRQWAMAKAAPRKYGQRVELAGDPERPLVPEMDIVERARLIAFVLEKAKREVERREAAQKAGPAAPVPYPAGET